MKPHPHPTATNDGVVIFGPHKYIRGSDGWYDCEHCSTHASSHAVLDEMAPPLAEDISRLAMARLRQLQAVADIAHEYVMKGGRPGRVQLMAKALAAAGYDMGQEKP